ncbi:MAG: HAD-IA family hydrolase [Bacteroidales bacterium]|nr:HAD-IA family hydrolase [Bacteroidales bacterium]
MIKAVLFDMDGVLVDSEEYICQAAIEMFREKGLTVEPEDFIPFVGAGENRYIGGVAEKYDHPLNLEQDKARTYEIYAGIVADKLEPLNGVLDFINLCKDSGLKIAVATSADEVKMEVNLREIGIPSASFDTTVNGLEIERKKPFPDIYLKAARLLNVHPGECLVVEDAPNGIKAAKSAGMKCLAVTTSFPPEELQEADWIAKDLEESIKLNIF